MTLIHDTEPPVRVAIVQRALRQYRGRFFDELRRDLARDGIEVLLYHSTPPREEDPRDDALEIPWARRLPRRVARLGRRELIWQPYGRELRRAQLVIVEQASDLVLNYRLLNAQRRGRTRVAFWGHGQNFAPDASTFGENLKVRTSRRVHWWFAYTEASAEVVRSFGYPEERITIVDNAIDTTESAADLREAGAGPAQRLRRELDLDDGPVGVFLGTLRPNKRLDLLFDAAARIHAVHDDFRLLVVGAGPLEDEVRQRAEQEPWLSYLGSRYGRERAAVLAAADLVLLPGWVGLVVLDAFVAGTPLITSAHSPHGPEIAYLRHRENGLPVDDGGDPTRYAEAVSRSSAIPACGSTWSEVAARLRGSTASSR